MDGLRAATSLWRRCMKDPVFGARDFDDPLFVEARRKVQKQLQREEERLRKRDKAPFPLRRPRLVDNDETLSRRGS